MVPLSSISQNIQNAIVAVEDQHFYQHKGVNPAGIIRAVVSNANGGSQGASTLTQQYVRNVLIEAGLQKDDSSAIAAATERSTARKLREIKYALTLEKKFSKEQIFEGRMRSFPSGIQQSLDTYTMIVIFCRIEVGKNDLNFGNIKIIGPVAAVAPRPDGQ